MYTIGGVSWLAPTTTTLGFITTASSTVNAAFNVQGILQASSTLLVGGTGTSTFAGGISATYLNLTGTTASSTFANGINITGGCFAKNGTCIGVNAVTPTVFTADGTWTQPSNTKFAQVIVTGSGGGGGGADGFDTTSEQAAGGGGAGGTAIEMITAASLGATETVTVGVAGAAGSNTGGDGGAGNASSFGAHSTGNAGNGGGGATDGAGGVCAVAGQLGHGGAGGTATGGDVNSTGGAGSGVIHCAAELAHGGPGGASYWGGGGVGANEESGAGCTAGGSGAYGSGGGGAACVDSTAGATGGAGAGGLVAVFSYTGSGADLAEWYETKTGVEPGDVVAISKDFIEYESFALGLQKNSILEKALPGGSVAGIVSAMPFEVIGGDLLGASKNAKPIALAGRVPVKVSEENGKIIAGDLLTISSVAGVAMRSTKAGVTIGRALEDSDCSEEEVCKVLVLVNTSYSTGALLKEALREDGIVLDTISTDLDLGRIILSHMIREKQDITASSTLSEIFTDRVVAGLEIISPRVVTDTLVTSAIEPMDRDVRMRLVSGGMFAIEKIDGSALSVSFGTTASGTSQTLLHIDDLGNALFAGALMAENLEIGTTHAPGGITLYDTETGEPYCTRVTKGRLITEQGRCVLGGLNPLLKPASSEIVEDSNTEEVPAVEDPLLIAPAPTSQSTLPLVVSPPVSVSESGESEGESEVATEPPPVAPEPEAEQALATTDPLLITPALTPQPEPAPIPVAPPPIPAPADDESGGAVIEDSSVEQTLTQDASSTGASGESERSGVESEIVAEPTSANLEPESASSVISSSNTP
ncbi:MAG: hypothetical protein Greene101415_1003 [Parcubacteria group bacterium Greene1014_15]|nr:MAG: hypothetical protein Greene101415_1003 [Parcubacteria group bacterium Greene1014_15]